MPTAHLSPLQVTRDGSILVLRTVAKRINALQPINDLTPVLCAEVSELSGFCLQRRRWRHEKTRSKQ